jgi:hypothetical protein
MFRFQMRSHGHLDAAFARDLCRTSGCPSDADGPRHAVVEQRGDAPRSVRVTKTLSQLSRLTVPSLPGTKRHPS